MMKKLLVVGVVLLKIAFPVFLFAQKGNVIKGKVYDVNTNDPLPYVTIYCSQCPVTSSSDVNGEFEISVLDNTQSLSFLYLGFKNKEVQLKERDSDPLSVGLTPVILNLSETIVRPNDQDFVEQMVKLAAKKIKENLRVSPYLARGFIRDISKEGNLYTRLFEGYGIYYDGGFKAEHAKSKNRYLNYDYFIFDQIRTTDTTKSLTHPWIFLYKKQIMYKGPLFKRNYKDYTFKIDSVSSFNDKIVYIVSFFLSNEKTKNLKGEGQIYIVPDDNYKVLKFTSKNSTENTVKLIEVEFVDFENSLNLKSIRQTSATNENGKTTEIQRELFVNSFSRNSCDELNYFERNYIGVWARAPIIKYSPKFWKSIDRGYNSQEILNVIAQSKNIDLEEFLRSTDGKRIKNIPAGDSGLFYNIEAFETTLNKLKKSDPAFFKEKSDVIH